MGSDSNQIKANTHDPPEVVRLFSISLSGWLTVRSCLGASSDRLSQSTAPSLLHAYFARENDHSIAIIFDFYFKAALAGKDRRMNFRARQAFSGNHAFRCISCAHMGDVTDLLGNAAGGDPHSLNQFYEQVYSELKAIAVQKMAAERPGHTLQPTALVHEAYLRLGGADRFKFENQSHFFASAAEAMRRILVESARRHCQIKRGGDQERVELEETRIAAPVDDENLLKINEALDALSREDATKAEVVKLRYFVGLKHQEIAEALGLSEVTVRRHWAVAKVRLFELARAQSERRKDE
jgi:RNA polymerase sigma factor (TIGR02999 family)